MLEFLPCTWNNGPPWRDLAGVLCCRCNTSQAEHTELSPWKPGLGQGMVARPGATFMENAVIAVVFCDRKC